MQARVFHYISRSLFKADRLTFGMHLVHGMYPKMFALNEWEAFVGLLVDGDGGGEAGGSAPGWVEPERKTVVARLRSNLRQLCDAAQLDNGTMWQGFAGAEECENEFPVQIEQKLTPFQQVVIVQALRPDRLVSMMEQFVASALNLKELAPPALSLRNVYKETQPSEPILIIVSSGKSTICVILFLELFAL
jgi:dynein heavy chain 2